MKDNTTTNVQLENGSPAFAKPVLPAVPSSVVYNEDCVEALKRFPDKYFDLAVVDPPYGIGAGNVNFINRYTANKNAEKFYRVNDWDKIRPDKIYFDELRRVSKNQIVWGGNYFVDMMQPARCFLVWDKKTGDNSYADCEMALTSFDANAKIYQKHWLGSKAKDHDGRLHPTQKPIGLYEWIYKLFAKEGDLILDTHLGSGSNRIAAHKAGLNFTGFEIDKDYYEAQEKRFKDFVSQLRMF